MSTNSFDVKAFFTNEDALAALVDPEDLFGFWNRSYRVPVGQCAVVIRKTGDRVLCSAGSDLTSDEVAEVIWVRTGTFSLKYTNVAVHSIDHYQCHADVELRVHLIPEAAELVGFRNRVIGSANTANHSTVADYFRPQIALGLAGAADGRGVGVLIDAENAETIGGELFESLKPAAFGAGVHIDAQIHIQIDAPMYRQSLRTRAELKRRREQISAKDRVEQARAQAERSNSERVATLLEQLRERAEASPSDSLATLVQQFDETERCHLYEALFATCDNALATDRIIVGSGDELLSFEPGSSDTPKDRITVAGDIGPIRSVQTYLDANGAQRLCIGASVGVYELAADLGGEMISYRADEVGEVRGGVNSVAIAGDQLYATHSELGLLVWDRRADEPARRLCREVTDPAKAVRCARFHPTGVYFSADHVVYRMLAGDEGANLEPFVGSRSIITAVCVTDRNVYAGNAEGEVVAWSLDRPGDPTVIHTGRRRSCESVFMVDFDGIERLFYTDTSSAVFARIIDDSFISRFEAGGQTLRRVEVAADLIVATNEARDRLFVWKTSTPDTPSAVLPIARLTTHSVQDVCLLPTVS